MNVVTWPDGVNDRFFAFSDKPKKNTITTKFMSGRTIGEKINSKNIMTFSCSIWLTKAELDLFWIWYNEVLCQDVNCFTCSGLGQNVYKIVDTPDPQDTNQTTRVLNLSIEEVF